MARGEDRSSAAGGLDLRYRVLVEQALPDALYVHDHEGRIHEVNHQACESVGYSRAELLTMSVLDLEQEYDVAAAQAVWSSIRSGTTHTIRGVQRRKDGSTFPVEVRFGLLDGAEDRLYIGLVRDITDQVRDRDEIARYAEQLRESSERTLFVIAGMVEVRDQYTAGHQRRTGELAAAIGVELGWAESQVEGVRSLGYVHDVGKIAVPLELLSKPGRLVGPELDLVRQHAVAGYEILKDIPFPWPLATAVRQHHERLDGSGYPDGLCGAEILPEARVLAVADVVEAMVSHRPYRPGWPLEVALDEIESGAGSRYDPDAVAACVTLFERREFVLSP